MVQIADRLGSVARRGGVEHLPDGLDPARFDHPRNVGAADPPRLTHVDGQLLDLGSQEPNLGPDQLHQQPCRVGLEHRVLVRGMMNQPGNQLLLGRAVAVQRQTRRRDLPREVGIRGPGLDHQHQHPCPARLINVALELLAIPGHKRIGIGDDDNASPGEERQRPQLIHHVGQARRIALETTDRQLVGLRAEDGPGNACADLTPQVNVVPVDHVNRLLRVAGRITQPFQCTHE